MVRIKIASWEPDAFNLETNTIWSFPERGDWATHEVGFSLKEIIKEQNNCNLQNIGRRTSQYNFLLLAHEYLYLKKSKEREHIKYLKGGKYEL